MKKKTNILLLMTDQHRLSAVGAYGETPCKTPTLDKLANEGIRFDKTYTVCPVCSPARSSIMSGQYPHLTEINCNIEDMGTTKRGLEKSDALLSERLQEAGYNLGFTGKWHIGDKLRPNDLGFVGHNFEGHGSGGFKYKEYQDYLKEKGLEHKVEISEIQGMANGRAGILQGPIESTVPYFLAENTISMIDKFANEEEPFFIWHNNWGPHSPYFATQEYYDSYKDIDIPKWGNYEWDSLGTIGHHLLKIHPKQKDLEWDTHWSEWIRCYYASATMIDDQFARIIHHLKEKGVYDNTIIIFTADHGETLGSHGGLTDKGFHHFEETHRIPLIIRFSDGRKAGTVIDDFASLADIYPTICEMAEAEYDKENSHGLSLVPLINDKNADWRESVVTEFNGVNCVPSQQRTIRWKDYKYGYTPAGKDELYDLEKDPNEMINLIDDESSHSIGDELRTRLLKWMKETKDPAAWLFAANRIPFYENN